MANPKKDSRQAGLALTTSNLALIAVTEELSGLKWESSGALATYFIPA